MRNLAHLPKAHLHLHLEGAMRPDTLTELAGRYGVPLPDLGEQPTFAQFLSLYDAACDVLRSADDLHRLFREVAEDARRDGAVWVETHVYPPLLAAHLGQPEAVLELMLDAARAAGRSTGVGVGLLVAADRTVDPQDAMVWARRAARHAGDGVVAFGLANDEVGHPPEPFAEAFAVARAAGLLCAPHAGELVGAAGVAATLDALRPHRVEHGVRAIEDERLLRRLAEQDVALDMCPTSNAVLGVVAAVSSHPLPAFLGAGVPVTLNADDPLMFGAGLLDEYQLARDVLGLDDAALAAIARSSLRHSGAPPVLKAQALAGVEAWLTG